MVYLDTKWGGTKHWHCNVRHTLHRQPQTNSAAGSCKLRTCCGPPALDVALQTITQSACAAVNDDGACCRLGATRQGSMGHCTKVQPQDTPQDADSNHSQHTHAGSTHKHRTAPDDNGREVASETRRQAQMQLLQGVGHSVSRPASCERTPESNHKYQRAASTSARQRQQACVAVLSRCRPPPPKLQPPLRCRARHTVRAATPAGPSC